MKPIYAGGPAPDGRLDDAARARGNAIRQAFAIRRRRIRRRVIVGAVALFVAAWLAITIVLVTGHDPALSKSTSTAASSTAQQTQSTGSGTSSVTASGGTSASNGTTSSSSNGSSGSSGASSVTTRSS